MRKVYCVIILILSNLYQSSSQTPIKIGESSWMSINLNVEHYANGDPIPQAKSDQEWKDCYAKKIGCWCYYNNDSTKSKWYGKLYNYYALNDPRGLAPKGWHVANTDDWMVLKSKTGSDAAGKNLKSKDGWNENGNGTNLYGFNGVAAGYRNKDGEFSSAGDYAIWWCMHNKENDERTLGFAINAKRQGLQHLISLKEDGAGGYSVRCIQDSN